MASPIPPGDATQVATLAGTGLAADTLQVFTYRPACTPRMLLIVFHGVGRNPGPYRNHATPIANQVCAIVVAPLFDKARFPQDKYQYGGVVGGQAPGRPVDLVAPLIAWARQEAGMPTLPVVLLAHSAGSQFLLRVAAFAPPAGVGYVIANPSTWVEPDGTAPPMGLGAATDAAVQAYVTLPMQILLGGADTGTNLLAMTPDAMAQGPNRLARGRTAFARATETARAHGWRLGWTLAEVPGVGHNATAMFASPQALAAVRASLPK